MKSIQRTLLSLLLLVGSGLHAQILGGSQAGLNAAMFQLFGEVTAFSARTEVVMLDARQKESMSTTMDFALLDGNMRIELEMSKMKSKDLPAETLAQFKSLGMDRMITVIRPARREALLIYPTLQAYILMPMAPEEAANYQKGFKVEKTKAGKETIDGHPCVKNKVIVKDHAGEKQDAVTWNAADLKDFPVKMQINQKDATVVMTHKNIRLTKPDAKLFEVPSGFEKHASVDRLAQAAMVKMFGGQK